MQTVLTMPMCDADPEIWSQAHSLLSSFSLVGHSLMAALVCQQLACSDTDSDPLAETSKVSAVCCVIIVTASSCW